MAKPHNKPRRRVEDGNFDPNPLHLKDRDKRIIALHRPQTPLLTRPLIARLLEQPDTQWLRHRLWQLVKRLEPGTKAPPLRRPSFQTRTEDAKSHRTITEARVDLPFKRIAHEGENRLHRFMRSMVCVYMHLAVTAKGYRWLWLDEILDHPKCPDHTKDAVYPLSFMTSHGKLTPDDLWRWHNGEVWKTHFVEIDRGTANIKSYSRSLDDEDSRYYSFEAKLPRYDELLSKRLYTDVLGITGKPYVIVITLKPGRMASMKEMVKERSLYPDRYLFACADYFGTDDWRIPPDLTYLFADPMQSVNGPVFLDK